MSTSSTSPSAKKKRAAHPAFVSTFSLKALAPCLPFRFPVPTHTARYPERRYRSCYRYLGAVDLADAAILDHLSLFEMALRLIDFSPLRDFLAQACYRGTTRGQVPFDPPSLFLVVCLRRELNLSWRRLADLLAGEHGSGWRRRFGFQDSDTPSASGLRYFFNTIGPQVFEELCPLFADLLPQQSTFPGDPQERGMTISHDIMLHPARSHMKCPYVTDTCYLPVPRPCPAQEEGKKGCDCTEWACAQMCRRTTSLDAEARYIHYEGRNKNADLDTQNKAEGGDVYGYASNPDRLIDDRFACAWTLRTGLHPANADERSLFPKSFAQLQTRFPWLKIGEVLADAAVGYQGCLDLIWKAGALRMVDIRAHRSDRDPDLRLQRGYDAQGHPLCVHGYQMHPNGHDYDHRRTKWLCRKTCLKHPKRSVPDCDYLKSEHKHGQTVNVGHTMPDGTLRLAREVPFGSRLWKKRYGRRNLSESPCPVRPRTGSQRLPASQGLQTLAQLRPDAQPQGSGPQRLPGEPAHFGTSGGRSYLTGPQSQVGPVQQPTPIYSQGSIRSHWASSPCLLIAPLHPCYPSPLVRTPFKQDETRPLPYLS